MRRRPSKQTATSPDPFLLVPTFIMKASYQPLSTVPVREKPVPIKKNAAAISHSDCHCDADGSRSVAVSGRHIVLQARHQAPAIGGDHRWMRRLPGHRHDRYSLFSLTHSLTQSLNHSFTYYLFTKCLYYCGKVEHCINLQKKCKKKVEIVRKKVRKKTVELKT